MIEYGHRPWLRRHPFVLSRILPQTGSFPFLHHLPSAPIRVALTRGVPTGDAPPAMRVPVVRVVVARTAFAALLVLLLALLLVAPADLIVQARRLDRGWIIVVLAAVYILTFLVAVFGYATRRYAAHARLAAIPRPHLPVRTADVGKAVRRLIVDGREASARTAYRAHPRELDDDPGDGETDSARPSAEDGARAPPTAPAVPPPTWGPIAHPGWAPPGAADAPGLQYEPVILELPSIIEAQAVALAPADLRATPPPASGDGTSQRPARPDPRAVRLLRRAPAAPLRAYLARLAALAMLPPADAEAARAAAAFLPRYEAARYAGPPLPEPAFRALLASFAALLAGLRPPDPARVAALARAESASGSLSSAGAAAAAAAAEEEEERSESEESRTTATSAAGSVVHHRRGKPAARSFETAAVTATPLPSVTRLGEDAATPTPSPTPFLTPRLEYPTSLSSGHAGDRSGEDEDERGSAAAGSARSARTAGTRPAGGRTPRPGRARARRRGETWVSAREDRASPAGEPVSRRASHESKESGGSVVVRRGASEVGRASEDSGTSAESVVIRRQASGVDVGLALPTASVAAPDGAMHSDGV